ncbi:YkuS family protein [Desulfofundulus thermocisternus]|uniref:YkuS family protein n=1 Tax=Desulfofundulus thermocisternus TaxID=42471 RepID=UPI0019FE2255|nr:YkuS family protein [Desulfofundulus thermocisternus]MBE3586739.1 YkuS family protein [Thermoanaerobacter sp.]MCS5697041.1 YkuS family protein [Desulfofundulus thermocisternus]
MNKKVAVEESLTGLKELLEEEGYTVVNPGSQEEVLAMVVTGLDNNTMNMQDINTRVPVIEMAGKTPEQVLARIKELE